MNVVLIYDITENKCSKVKKCCNKYLNHVQNSVFEGDITSSKLMELENELKTIIDKETDSVIIYKINNPKWINKNILGIEKNSHDNFI
jgi:CRISPR-associated protein Cas2